MRRVIRKVLTLLLIIILISPSLSNLIGNSLVDINLIKPKAAMNGSEVSTTNSWAVKSDTIGGGEEVANTDATLSANVMSVLDFSQSSAVTTNNSGIEVTLGDASTTIIDVSDKDYEKCPGLYSPPKQYPDEILEYLENNSSVANGCLVPMDNVIDLGNTTTPLITLTRDTTMTIIKQPYVLTADDISEGINTIIVSAAAYYANGSMLDKYVTLQTAYKLELVRKLNEALGSNIVTLSNLSDYVDVTFENMDDIILDLSHTKLYINESGDEELDGTNLASMNAGDSVYVSGINATFTTTITLKTLIPLNYNLDMIISKSIHKPDNEDMTYEVLELDSSGNVSLTPSVFRLDPNNGGTLRDHVVATITNLDSKYYLIARKYSTVNNLLFYSNVSIFNSSTEVDEVLYTEANVSKKDGSNTFKLSYGMAGDILSLADVAASEANIDANTDSSDINSFIQAYMTAKMNSILGTSAVSKGLKEINYIDVDVSENSQYSAFPETISQSIEGKIVIPKDLPARASNATRVYKLVYFDPEESAEAQQTAMTEYIADTGLDPYEALSIDNLAAYKGLIDAMALARKVKVIDCRVENNFYIVGDFNVEGIYLLTYMDIVNANVDKTPKANEESEESTLASNEESSSIAIEEETDGEVAGFEDEDYKAINTYDNRNLYYYLALIGLVSIVVCKYRFYIKGEKEAKKG
ncbi:hypothetical protein [Lachnospira multipara]|uniref:hypothetical protein n=1 Tax=Lachnospira multipara TaxID=28051 RepID=UPI000482D205|nr:hypothetical protein [Lachnospira multipara]